MDPLVQLLMDKYGLSVEAAQQYAHRISKDLSPVDLQIGEATVAPSPELQQLSAFDSPEAQQRRAANPEFWQSQRGQARLAQVAQQRVNYYNGIVDRMAAGEPLTTAELAYYRQVQEAGAKRQPAMAAARKLSQPQLDLEIGPARIIDTSRLQLLEDAQKRRQANASFWTQPEHAARAKKLDDELLAERKKLGM